MLTVPSLRADLHPELQADQSCEASTLAGRQHPLTQSPGPIDQALIAPLRDLGPDDFRQLIGMFLDEAATRVVRLQAAAQQGQMTEVSAIAHTLRGTSATFGAVPLAALCGVIEAGAASATPAGIAKLSEEVATEFELVRAALMKELS